MTHRQCIAAMVAAASWATTASAVAQQPAANQQAGGDRDDSDEQRVVYVSDGVQPDGPVTPFEELIVEGLDSHPGVERRRQKVRIEQARLSGVGLIPDPTVKISGSNLPWDDPRISQMPMSGIQLMVSQPLWWPGELEALRDEVRDQAAAAMPLANQKHVELTIEAAGVFYDIYRVDRTVEALDGLKVAVREIVDLLEARISTGKATVARVERARLELMRIDERIVELDDRRRPEVARLNALLNRPSGRPVNPPVETSGEALQTRLGPEVDGLDELVDKAMKRRPTVQLLQRRQTAARGRAQSAKFDAYPDVSVFGGWRFRGESSRGAPDGTDLVTVGVSSTLPIWSGERAAAAGDVAEAKVIALNYELAEFRLELRGQIDRHLARLESLVKHAELLHEGLIPQAMQARRASRAGLSAGKVGYEDWIEAQQQLVELKTKLVGVEADIKKQRAVILALTGQFNARDVDHRSATLPQNSGDEP